MRTLLIIFATLFSISCHAAQITMTECNEKVAEINATLPMQLDNITTWVSTTCVEPREGRIQLVYANQVKNGSPISQEQLDMVLDSIVMSWCFGPDLIPLLSAVDAVNYQYDFENGQHIGELNFTEFDCDMGRQERSTI